MSDPIGDQEEALTEAVKCPSPNRKRLLWGLQLVACVALLPWSLPIMWKKIKESKKKGDS